MFELLSPISLLALSAVALPLILHLRKDRKSKVLLVGSVSLFPKEARFRGKRRRISEWLLLALRMLLVALLALLLARPVWRTRPAQTGGWLLIDPGAYTQRKQLVDSLLRTGYELHAFERGFPVIAAGDTPLAPASDTAMAPAAYAASYWSLAALVQRQSPPGISLYVLTTNQLSLFKGPRPVIEPRLHWNTYPSVVQNPADTGLSITAYGDDRRYIEAAAKALAQYTGRKLTVTALPPGGILPDKQDWLFWLSTQPLPPGKKATHLFRYEPGKDRGDNASIDFGEARNLVAQPVSLYRIVSAGNAPTGAIPAMAAPPVATTARAVWQDPWGNPLLTSDDTTLHFYSRLDPAWNDLVWSPSFPAILARLLYTRSDFGTIDATQLLPDGAAGDTKHAGTTDLSHVLWLAAFILFILERVLARKEGRDAA